MQHLDQMLVSLRRVGLLKLNIRGRSSMSQKLFNLTDDLRQLLKAGYHVQIIAGFHVMTELPYVNAQKCVRKGTLVTSLDPAGHNTRKPGCQVMHWDGEYPC